MDCIVLSRSLELRPSCGSKTGRTTSGASSILLPLGMQSGKRASQGSRKSGRVIPGGAALMPMPNGGGLALSKIASAFRELRVGPCAAKRRLDLSLVQVDFALGGA
jgi:hypothetical protein